MATTLQDEFSHLELDHTQQTGCVNRASITLTTIGGPFPGVTVQNFSGYDRDPLTWKMV